MILGMDWLSRHQVVVDCRMKRVTLRTPSGKEVTFIDERLNHLSNVISAATTRTMVRKGCEAYLVYVIDTKKAEPSFSNIPIVVTIQMCFQRSFQDCLHIERLSFQLTLFRVSLRHPLHRIKWLQWS